MNVNIATHTSTDSIFEPSLGLNNTQGNDQKQGTQSPLYYSNELRAWVLRRYSDVQFVLSNKNLFSAIEPDGQNVDPAFLTIEQHFIQNQALKSEHELYKTFVPKQIQAFSHGFLECIYGKVDVDFVEIYSKYFVDESVNFFADTTLSRDANRSFTTQLSFVHPFSVQIMARALWLLSNKPDIWQSLRRTPSYIPAFFDELLRLHSPQQGFLRYALEDIVLHGEVIPSKQRLIALTSVANRDPGQFVRENEFLITRKVPGRGRSFWHLSKGHSVAAQSLELSKYLLELILYNHQTIAPSKVSALQTKPSFLTEYITHLPISLVR